MQLGPVAFFMGSHAVLGPHNSKPDNRSTPKLERCVKIYYNSFRESAQTYVKYKVSVTFSSFFDLHTGKSDLHAQWLKRRGLAQ